MRSFAACPLLAALFLGGPFAACWVDLGPTSDQCAASSACRPGYRCDLVSHRCIGTFALDVTVTGTGAGTVVSAPMGIDCGPTCTASFDERTAVRLTATAAPGSTFTGWSGAGCTGTGTCDITMTAPVGVTATFSILHRLTIVPSGSGAGRVTSNPMGIDCDSNAPGTGCSALFDDGTSVTLSALASMGSTFEGWSAPGCGGTGPCMVGLVSDLAVTATFFGGGALWARGFGGTDFDVANGVAVDPAGDVLVTGSFQNTVDFGDGVPVTSAGNEDVFVAKYSGADGRHVWSRTFGGTGAQIGRAVAVDPAGDVAITGLYEQSVSFGGSTFTYVGYYDIFVAKLSGADGSHLWSRSLGGTGADAGVAIAMDAAGNVALAGNVDRCSDLGAPTQYCAAGMLDAFVAKYASADGSWIWSNAFGSAQIDYGNGVAFDPAGDVIFTGSFQGGVNFGDGVIVNASGASDAFVIKYAASNGADVWSHGVGGSGPDSGYAVATDSGGNVVIVGAFDGTFASGMSNFPTHGFLDVFVARFSSGGNPLWAIDAGGVDYDSAYSVAADDAGDPIVTGYFRGTADFSGYSLTGAGMEDIFVAAYASADGALRWAHGYGGPDSDLAFAIAAVPAAFGGGSIVVGNFSDAVAFGTTTLPNAGISDAFLLRSAP